MISALTLNAVGKAQTRQRVTFGRAHNGSRRRLQDYINDHLDRLSAALSESLPEIANRPGSSVRWVSPLARDNYIEYRDHDFLRVVGLGMWWPELEDFWPQPGPSWDALALTSLEDKAEGIILVEAKSHLTEICVSGCKAEGSSRVKIEKALTRAKLWCGVPEKTDWMGSAYLYARHIAHLYFLREVVKHNAWLVNLYFLNDPIGPANRLAWEHELSQAKAQLGFDTPLPYSIDMFLPALVSGASAAA